MTSTSPLLPTASIRAATTHRRSGGVTYELFDQQDERVLVIWHLAGGDSGLRPEGTVESGFDVGVRFLNPSVRFGNYRTCDLFKSNFTECNV